MGEFSKRVELAWGGLVTNGANSSSLITYPSYFWFINTFWTHITKMLC